MEDTLDPRAARIVSDPEAGFEAIAHLPFEEQHPLVRAACQHTPEIVSTNAFSRWCDTHREAIMEATKARGHRLP